MTIFFSAPSDSPSSPSGSEAGRWEGRLFGPFRLIAPDGAVATPAGRKARALVAYLLAATEDVPTRDRLAGLLWSERGDDQARASLRQTLYELRALTSGDAPLIIIDRSRVTVVVGRVTTDVARLDEAARADDASTLVAVVGRRPAEFLADLDGVDPAFDDWLSVERTRRRVGRRRALMAAADRRLAAHDADAAQQLSDCLLACDPADEAAARVAMQASHRHGDRDAVRRHFASLGEALRREVGVEPSDETEQVYRHLMAAPRPQAEPPPVVATNDDRRDDPQAVEDAGEPTPLPAPLLVPAPVPVPALAAVADSPGVVMDARSPYRSRRSTWLAAVLALLIVAAVELVGWRNGGGASMQRVLLVQPMQVAPDDQAAAALRLGFSAELARVLVGRPAFVVRDADHGSDEAPERTFVVAADTQSEDGVLHVGLRLLARKDGPILWSTTLARPVGEVAALREQMAAKVADVALCALDGRHTDLRDFRPETLQLLLGACDLRHTDSIEATKLLQQLTQRVPEFAHGWALLAEMSGGNGDVTAPADGTPTPTESYARRAIERDPHDGDAYLGRAFEAEGIARWPQRMAILREGLATDPDNADLATALAHNFAQLGYVQQAIAWSKRAVHEDPFDPITAAEHAKVLGMGGPSFGPEANAAFDDARRRFGADPHLLLAEFRFQALVGDYRRAAQFLVDPSPGMHFHPDRAAMWKALIASRADPSAAHDAAAERAFIAAMRAIPDINPWTLETLAFFHRVDEAYADADRMDARPIWEDATDSLFSVASQPLRADPRFMTLAARLGLVKFWRETGDWPDFCRDPSLGYDCRSEAERALSADPRPLVAKP